MTVEPLRVAFRRQVREQVLDVAHRETIALGWDRVRVGDVAVAAGMSRPTLYKEFPSKQALGEAMVLREIDRFLAGITGVLEAHGTGDATAAVTAAVAYTLAEAHANPLLHAVLTSTRQGGGSLLPTLTTRSAPLLAASTAALSGWFAQHFPDLPAADVAEGVDALVRLTVSHLVQPAADPAGTAERLAKLAVRYLAAAGG